MKFVFINAWNQYVRGDVIEPYSASFAEWLVINKFVEPIKPKRTRRKK